MRMSIIGLGFISDRHIAAIKALGHELVAGCDIDEGQRYKIGEARFYTDYEKMLDNEQLDYVAICTPNYLHATMAEKALAKGIKVICEKPPVLREEDIETLNNDNLSVVLQCRYSPEIKNIKIDEENRVEMNIEVYRDEWYMKSWKADDLKSGGLLYNIGCHYFDLLSLLFGKVVRCDMASNTPKRCSGTIKFENALVFWTVAIDAPIEKQKRLLKINDNTYNLTQMGFENLHTKVYEEILAGRGLKLKEFIPTSDLIERLYGRD